jgi:hypothetical protein
MSIISKNQDKIALDVYFFLKSQRKNQRWLAKKISTKKRKYTQPEISRAINGRDMVLLKQIRRALKLPENV